RQTRPVVIWGLSRPPNRAESESGTGLVAGPGMPGGGRTPPPGLGGTIADGAIDGGTILVVPDGRDEPALGASWRGERSDDGKANWAAAVPGQPAPHSRAASTPPAP
ncbi:MAG: hypothetical protein JO228_08305, partial [Xanthobacteraceae bacterium]|nr:hypothetical protein [Xanthobacteraceae bacterium]